MDTILWYTVWIAGGLFVLYKVYMWWSQRYFREIMNGLSYRGIQPETAMKSFGSLDNFALFVGQMKVIKAPVEEVIDFIQENVETNGASFNHYMISVAVDD